MANKADPAHGMNTQHDVNVVTSFLHVIYVSIKYVLNVVSDSLPITNTRNNVTFFETLCKPLI